MDMVDLDRNTEAPVTTAPLVERRRAGRVDYQNPHLIELLRKPGTELPLAEPADELVTAEEDVDPLAPGRGLFLGVLIGTGMWIAGGLTFWWLL
jgi:hypothetical protein